MKLLIASDIHGDLDSMEKVLAAYKKEGAEKILLLGDLLYHGPRNDLPATYAPKAVIELLNANKNNILTDFFETGVYDKRREFYLTKSPSMDILISSNFERLLWFVSQDDKYVAQLMDDLKQNGLFEAKDLLARMDDFVGGFASE